MNKSHIGLIFYAVLVTSLASCGGGGNDGTTDDNDRNVSGNWSGAITKTGDTCSPSSSQTVTFQHTVSQNSSAVQLSDGNSIQYLGNLVGEDGFSVDATQSVAISGATCQDARRIEYDSVVDDDDTTADFDFTITRSCPGAAVCTITYTGTASRPAGDNGNAATPVPSSTTTPSVGISGGCSDINPNTNSGTYSGDGGCSISEAKFRKEVQGSETVVILEPFGANGSTSFVINPSQPSTATSRRSDLTINGTSGYTCNLTCSPPSTFTATCTKEGGTSCTEKF